MSLSRLCNTCCFVRMDGGSKRRDDNVYRELTRVSDRTASRDLETLAERGRLKAWAGRGAALHAAVIGFYLSRGVAVSLLYCAVSLKIKNVSSGFFAGLRRFMMFVRCRWRDSNPQPLTGTCF